MKLRKLLQYILCCCCYNKKRNGDLYICGCRLWDEDDACTTTGCVNCLLSVGGKTWFSILLFWVWTVFGGIMFSLLEEDTFSFPRNETFLNAAYFSAVTITTIGFGDYAFHNASSRIVLFFYAHVGIFLTGVMGSFVAGTVVNKLKCRHLRVYAVKNKYDSLRSAIDTSTKYPIIPLFIVYVILMMLGSAVFMWNPLNANPQLNDLSIYSNASNFQYWGFENGFYYTWNVITTVGYGNLTTKRIITRIVTILFAMIGVGYLGLIMNSTANFLTTKMEKSLKTRIKADRMRRASYHPNADIMLKQPPKKIQKCLASLIEQVETNMITENDKLVTCKLLLAHFEKGVIVGDKRVSDVMNGVEEDNYVDASQDDEQLKMKQITKTEY